MKPASANKHEVASRTHLAQSMSYEPGLEMGRDDDEKVQDNGGYGHLGTHQASLQQPIIIW